MPVPTRSSSAPTRKNALLRTLRRGPIPVWLPLLLGFLAAVGPLSTDAYLPAFPAIEQTLHGAAGSAQITLATWFAGLAVGQIVQGPLCDRFGRRAPLLLGTVLFTASSAGCALATGIDSLSTFRFLAAVGASASMVVPRAIVRDLRDGHEARRLMAQLILVMGAVPILAPSLGGVLLIVASWRVIFWIAVGYGVLAFVLVARLLPDTLAPEMRVRVDFATQITRYASILTERGFMTNAGIGGMTLFGLFAYLGGSPTAYVHQYDLTPAQYALAFSANAAVYIGSAQLGVPLTARFGLDRLLRVVASLFVVVSLLLLAVAVTGAGGLWMLIASIAFNMICMGLLGPLAPVAALARHAKHAGSASALLGTLQFVLGAVASWFVGEFDDGTARPLATLLVVGAVCAKIAERARPKATANQV